nr:DUF4113 domain-containing protein [Legionella saoudiensis]
MDSIANLGWICDKTLKGRTCCQKIDERFRHMDAELYNLWPESGLINQARSNYRFGMVPGQDDYFGCTIKIDKATRRVEPADVAKGVVARAEGYSKPWAMRAELKSPAYTTRWTDVPQVHCGDGV